MGHEECKRLQATPSSHVAPPACVSVGGAIPVEINIAHQDLPHWGSRPHACMCWCEHVDGLMSMIEGIASSRMCRQVRTRSRSASSVC